MSGNDGLIRRPDGTIWYRETLHEKDGLATEYRVTQVLFDSATPHQRLIVVDTDRAGRLVALDGATQVTMGDEFVYHEMMAHVPLLAHGAATDVLIIGGGDGGLAEEVLKHRTVRRLVMVEIDASVIDFARTHLAALNRGAFDDPRLELVISDGKDYAASAGAASFDVILVDSTDPVGPGEVLFTRPFHGDCKRLLKPRGILVTQSGVPFLQPAELASTVGNFATLFADAGCYLAVVPSYVGGFMALGWGSDDPSNRAVPRDVLEARFAAAGLSTRYYTPAVHQAAFALPAFIEAIVDGAKGG